MPISVGEIQATMSLRDQMTPAMTKIAAAQQRLFAKQAKEAEDAAEKVKRAMESSARAAGRASEKAERDATDAARRMAREQVKAAKDAERAWNTLGPALSGVGMKLTALATVPIAAAFGGSVKAAMDFETTMASVKKTVGATEVENAKLDKSIRAMALTMPITTTQLGSIAAMAGQMGVKAPDIAKFTQHVAELGVAVDGISTEDAAKGLAQIGNSAGQGTANIDKMASTLVHLGNSSNSTEGDILEFSKRLIGTGHTIGLTIPQVMALGTSMADVGINAELGSTAMEKVMGNMAKAVAKGGSAIKVFADVAKMDITTFSHTFKTKPMEAIEAFMKGLSDVQKSGGNMYDIFSDMGEEGVRLQGVLLRMAGASGGLSSALKVANEGWQTGNKHTAEAQAKFNTLASQLAILWNNVKDVGITFGNAFIPALTDAVKAVKPFVEWLGEMAKVFAAMPGWVKTGAIALLGLVAAGGPMLLLIGKTIEATREIIALRTALLTLGGANVASGIGGLAGALGRLTPFMRGGLIVGAGALALGGLSAVGKVLDPAPDMMDAELRAEIERLKSSGSPQAVLRAKHLEDVLASRPKGLGDIALPPSVSGATGGVPPSLYRPQIDPEEAAKMAEYTKDLQEKIQKRSLEALDASGLRLIKASTKQFAVDAELARDVASAIEGGRETRTASFMASQLRALEMGGRAGQSFNAPHLLDDFIDPRLIGVGAQTLEQALGKRPSGGLFSGFGGKDGIMSQLGPTIMSAITGGGNVGGAVGGLFGGQMFGNIGKMVGPALTGALGKTLGGAIGSVIPGIGTMVGSLVGPLVGKLFGGLFGGEGKKANDARDQILAQAGGFEKVAEAAAKAGVSIEPLLKAKKVKDVEKAWAALTKQLGEYEKQQAEAAAKEAKRQENAARFTETFKSGLDRVAASGTLVSREMRSVMDQVAATGELSAETAAFMQQSVQTGISGITGFLQNATVSTQASANAFMSAIAASFQQLQQGGLTTTEALDAVSPAILALEEQMAAAGLTGSGAFEQLRSWVALAGDEIAGPALDAVGFLNQAFIGLHNSGLLNQEMFIGLAGQVATTFQSLVSQGYNGDAALQLMQPTLQTIWELQEDFGYAVDAATQAMLAQAVAAGIVGQAHRSEDEQIIDLLEIMVETLQDFVAVMIAAQEAAAVAGEVVGDLADETATLPQNPFDGWAMPDIPPPWADWPAPPVWDQLPPGSDIPGFTHGTGGFVDFGAGTLAMLHGREAVVPEGEVMPALPSVGRDFGGSRSNVHDDEVYQSIEGLKDAILRSLPKAIRVAVSDAMAGV